MKKWLTAIVLIGVFAGGAAADSRTVYDQLGRKVSVPMDPSRVVALAPSITEIVFALGQGYRLVGVTRFSNYPTEAASLPRVGSYVQLNLEKIVALNPDLCLSVKDGNPRQVVTRLSEMGVPVYAVDPRNFESVLDTVVKIGSLLNANEPAEALVDRMGVRVQKVAEKVARESRRPNVFFQIGIRPMVAVGTDTFIHELIEMAGGHNATAGPVPYPRYSWEQVVALAPDVIIITTMARDGGFESIKADWSHWKEIPAVKYNRLYVVNSDLFDRASPRLVDALEVLVDIIHPQPVEETR